MAEPAAFTLAWRAAAGPETPWQTLCTLPTRLLSTETAGGFTGVFIGPYAGTSAGRTASAPADFSWFEFEPLGD